MPMPEQDSKHSAVYVKLDILTQPFGFCYDHVYCFCGLIIFSADSKVKYAVTHVPFYRTSFLDTVCSRVNGHHFGCWLLYKLVCWNAMVYTSNNVGSWQNWQVYTRHWLIKYSQLKHNFIGGFCNRPRGINFKCNKKLHTMDTFLVFMGCHAYLVINMTIQPLLQDLGKLLT